MKNSFDLYRNRSFQEIGNNSLVMEDICLPLLGKDQERQHMGKEKDYGNQSSTGSYSKDCVRLQSPIENYSMPITRDHSFLPRKTCNKTWFLKCSYNIEALFGSLLFIYKILLMLIYVSHAAKICLPKRQIILFVFCVCACMHVCVCIHTKTKIYVYCSWNQSWSSPSNKYVNILSISLHIYTHTHSLLLAVTNHNWVGPAQRRKFTKANF